MNKKVPFAEILLEEFFIPGGRKYPDGITEPRFDQILSGAIPNAGEVKIIAKFYDVTPEMISTLVLNGDK